ncbi:MAG: arylsulfatase A-like enzyme [Rhodothermales bacterium]|jgi:arylsulfatase A-like enzyme
MRPTAVLGFLLALLMVGCAAPSDPPNIVLVYVDDMGWRDLAVQGSNYYLTPQIDQLAGEGRRYTSAYANAPNCAPSRAALLTGLYGPRHGIYTVNSAARGRAENRKLIPPENQTVLDTSFVTIAEALRDKGYRTGFFGKWHLGEDVFGPTGQGFDEAAGWTALGSPPSYSWPYERGAFTLTDLRDSGQPGENLTDRLVDESIRFIEGGEAPFFLMLSHYAVHTPIQADSARIGRFDTRPADGGHRDARYASMIAAVDDGLGRLREALDRTGQAENTYIVFMSDNGGYGPITDMLPLRGSKGMLYEGGVRVPLLVVGPGIEPGLDDTPVMGADLYPTFLDWAGSSTQELDGRSLDDLRAWERPLFWHFPAYLEAYRGQEGPWRTTPASAMRRGRFKLIRFYEDGGDELYDLVADPGESVNLAADRPRLATELGHQLNEWLEETEAYLPRPVAPAPGPTTGSSRP